MKIEPIDPTRSASWIVEGLHPDLSEETLHDLIIRTTSRDPALYIAAFDGERVVGLACFRPHYLSDGGPDPSLAFQAAGVLTSPAYRGRGIFPNIVRQAEEILRSRNASMIFGFPNSNAYPIWIKKLGYGEVGVMKWRTPLALGVFNFLISNEPVDAAGAIFQDDQDLIASKQPLYGSDLVSIEINGSVAWAIKRSSRKLGMNVSMLDIGGIRCRSGRDFKTLLAALIKNAGTVEVARLVATTSNPILKILRMARPGATHETVIYKWLNRRDSYKRDFAFYSGMADWF